MLVVSLTKLTQRRQLGLHLLELAKTVLNSHIAMTDSSVATLNSVPELLVQATVFARWAESNIHNFATDTTTPISAPPVPWEEVSTLKRALQSEWDFAVSH
jgi:hypothetical protein